MNHSQKIITKCDGIITNCDSLVYYKVRWTVITNCDTFFITKCDMVYYKLRQVLQSAMDLLQIATGITKCDDYYKLRQYTRLHTPLFFQKSTLLRCVTSAFRISSYCYIRVCFSLIFLLIWRICFHSGPLPMIFVVTIFSHLVNLKQLPMVWTPFLTFQLSSGMHCRTFSY